MNPAEEIVRYWLQEKGYFVQSSIQLGRKEIDLLAIHNKDKNDRRHIEVSVSIRMVDPKNTAKSWVRNYEENKMRDRRVETEVRKRFNSRKYAREVVVGDVKLKKKASFRELKEEFRKRNIKAYYFGDILNEITPSLKRGMSLNPIIKSLQLYRRFNS